ncbi:hypothetical protein KAS79_03080 [Candidatus Parcubacteria bacterium]|nr:hypothetical protein [Candidatus Parcubacteria bacterium]
MYPITKPESELEDSKTNITTGKIPAVEQDNFYIKKLEEKFEEDAEYGFVDQKTAREIMGYNFLRIEETAKCFGIQFTESEFQKIKMIPYSEKTLRKYRKSHILFLGSPKISFYGAAKPTTIKELKNKFPQSKIHYNSELIEEDFIEKQKIELRWYLVNCLRYGYEYNQGIELFSDAEKKLKNNEYIEKAVLYIYSMILMNKMRYEMLFTSKSVWCDDVDSVQRRVYIDLSGNGISVSSRYATFNPSKKIVIAPAIKPEF